MIALAWTFFVVLSMVVASSQAFHTLPLTEAERGPLSAATTTTTTTAATNATNATAAVAGLRMNVTTLVQDSLERDDDSDEYDLEDRNGGYAVWRGPDADGRDLPHKTKMNEFEMMEAERGVKDEGYKNRDKGLSDDGLDSQSALDPWSIVWYIGSFGGLVAFFLIVSCSEWCCRRGARPVSAPYAGRRDEAGINSTVRPVSESPPPPYHLFAPPPYDSVNYAEVADKSANGEKLDIYVITLPIHHQPAQPTHQLQVPGTRAPA
ncbi:uncharacterized protein LOC106645685 [Copidosoma floridanum]|uniref:uncharacterized protein LOC106645685 n=1 Tax=Copidosoma floridanum TaxID=29053 RepID=UPI0006C93C4A|nr:uncharacterized protein LOC106645685 [Copidosoma floridanum]